MFTQILKLRQFTQAFFSNMFLGLVVFFFSLQNVFAEEVKKGHTTDTNQLYPDFTKVKLL